MIFSLFLQRVIIATILPWNRNFLFTLSKLCFILTVHNMIDIKWNSWSELISISCVLLESICFHFDVLYQKKKKFFLYLFKGKRASLSFLFLDKYYQSDGRIFCNQEKYFIWKNINMISNPISLFSEELILWAKKAVNRFNDFRLIIDKWISRGCGLYHHFNIRVIIFTVQSSQQLIIK